MNNLHSLLARMRRKQKLNVLSLNFDGNSAVDQYGHTVSLSGSAAVVSDQADAIGGYCCRVPAGSSIIVSNAADLVIGQQDFEIFVRWKPNSYSTAFSSQFFHNKALSTNPGGPVGNLQSDGRWAGQWWYSSDQGLASATAPTTTPRKATVGSGFHEYRFVWWCGRGYICVDDQIEIEIVRTRLFDAVNGGIYDDGSAWRFGCSSDNFRNSDGWFDTIRLTLFPRGSF